jgi:pyridinium-3,5-bisthiocarboxylic acid mononucleotide nickel chelatase
MTRIAYLDCGAGLAGDMVLGALLDAGAPEPALIEAVAALGLDDVKVELERVTRGGISATHVAVLEGDATTSERPGRELLSIVETAALLARVRDRALEALTRLIDAEAAIHGVAVEDLVVHELSGADTLVDVVGAFALFEALGIDEVVCSPVPYARGRVSTAHGELPSPGPAVVELLRGAAMVGVDADHELVTPTGAAIVSVAASRFGELPPLVVERVGYGAGSRETGERANVLRIVVGDAASSFEPQDAVLLEATMDDLIPELVPDVLDACRAAGSLDVWTAPVQMKKGRTGVNVTAVARLATERAVARALLEHSSSLGVRAVPIRRYELERTVETVEVDGHQVRVKVASLEGRVVNAAPEHDDCASVAAELGRPVKEIWASALAAASRWIGTDAGAR